MASWIHETPAGPEVAVELQFVGDLRMKQVADIAGLQTDLVETDLLIRL